MFARVFTFSALVFFVSKRKEKKWNEQDGKLKTRALVEIESVVKFKQLNENSIINDTNQLCFKFITYKWEVRNDISIDWCH